MVVALPLTGIVRAAGPNASPGTVTTAVTVFQGGATGTVSWTLSNPLSNGFNIVEFLVNAGGAGASPAFSLCSDSEAAFTANYPLASPQEVDFTFNGGLATPLAPGSHDIFSCTFKAAAQSGGNAADQYTQTYKTQDSTANGLVTAGTITVYVTGATADLLYKTSVYTPSPQTHNTLVAGSSVFIEFRLQNAGNVGVAGVPVFFTLSSPDGSYNASGMSTLTASGITSADGKVNATFFPDPVIADQVTGAFVIATAGNSGQTNPNLIADSVMFYLVITAAAPNAIAVTIHGGDLNQAQGTLPIPNTDITVSSTDIYGNPAPAAADIVITLAAVNVVGTTAGWSGSSGYPPSGLSVSASVTIPAGHQHESAPSNYFFGLDYGDQSYITATASGFPVANSKTITTWGFNYAGAGDEVFLKPSTPKNVVAGGTITISWKFTNPQANVPVNFNLIVADNSSGYNGYFYDNPQWANITVLTNANGVASTDFKVATMAGAFAQIGVSYPGDYPQATFNGGNAATAVITTIAGTAVSLSILASYDNHCTVFPCNFKSNAAPYPDNVNGFPAGTGDAVNGTTLYLDVISLDNYSNLAVISSLSNTQVALSPPGGLSAFTLYIAAGQTSTSGLGFGPVSWNVPATVGSVMDLTATSTNMAPASLTINVVSAMPSVFVTSPAVVDAVIYSRFSSVTFMGNASVSLGFATTGPNKVNIVTVGYSLNGGVWHTHTVAPAAPFALWSFAVALPSGINTVQFNATDGKGDTAVTPIMQVLVDSSAPKIGFTTANHATVANGNPVMAWAYDTLGDFNVSSVVVKANNVALPASDVAITGTNTLGSNSSFGITITGLTAGTWTLTMTASDYAGNVAAAATITVTVTVAQGSTFTSTGAAQCTSGGFTGDCITLVNNAASAETVNVYFVWYNSAGQIVNIGAQLNVSFAAGASASFFSAYGSSGSYTVQAFVRDTSNNALSQQYSATVVIP